MVRLFSICLHMREIASACRGYSNSFGTKFDICCEPREKITECACALSEAIPVCVYMKKNSLTKPIYRLAQVMYRQSKITHLGDTICNTHINTTSGLHCFP